MGPHNAWNARGYGRTARRPKHEPIRESLRSLVSNGHLLCHKRALSADASNLPTPNQLIDSASDGQACRTEFLGEVFFGTESWNP